METMKKAGGLIPNMINMALLLYKEEIGDE